MRGVRILYFAWLRERAGRSEDAYARDLVDFLADVAGTAPWLALIDRVGLELGRLGLPPGAAAFASAARVLASQYAPLPGGVHPRGARRGDSVAAAS